MAEGMVKETEMEEDTQKNKFLTFTLGAEVYGIEIKYVTEIIGMQPIIEVPDLPDFVKGIINLRGKIIPVIDMRLRFKKAEKEYNDRTCIIVVDVREIAVGLIVDAVAEVLTIPEQDIVPPPQLHTGSYQQQFTKAIGKVGSDVKLILDSERVLSNDEASALGTALEE